MDKAVDARTHQRVDGRNDQVHRGLLAAAHARAVAADHRAIALLLEKQRRQHADAFVHVSDVDEAVRRVGQLLPEIPVPAQPIDDRRLLLDRHQRAIGTDRDAEVAALAGLGVDRDREQSAGARLFPFGAVEERTCLGDREVGEDAAQVREVFVEHGALLRVPAQLRRDVVVCGVERRGERRERLGLENATRFLREMLRDLTNALERAAVCRLGDADLDQLIDVGDQTGNGRIGTLRPALRAPGALGGDELGHLEPHAGHVAHGAGRRRNRADRGIRIGDAVAAGLVQVADLLPEATRIADAGQGVWLIEQIRDRRDRCLLVALQGKRGAIDRPQLPVPAFDDAGVVVHHSRAELSELLLQLVANSGKEPRVVETVGRSDRRHGEERSHERRALHPIAEIDVRCLGAGDSESVEQEEPDVAIAERAAGRQWNRTGEGFGGGVTLNHERAAVGEAGQRVRVTEDVRIGRKDDVDVAQLAVEPDRLLREGRVERRRLALLFRAVLRVRLDVQIEQLEHRAGDVLSHRDRAPSANGMDAQRDGAGREQIRVAHGRQRQVAERRIPVRQLLLPDLKLRAVWSPGEGSRCRDRTAGGGVRPPTCCPQRR